MAEPIPPVDYSPPKGPLEHLYSMQLAIESKATVFSWRSSTVEIHVEWNWDDTDGEWEEITDAVEPEC